MKSTAELRWFRREPFPGPVLAWFDESAGPPEIRSDSYLVLPGTDALGLKVRGGSTTFEVKLRLAPGEPISLPSGGSGQREEWRKWSFGRGGVTRILPRLGLPKEGWVTVVKHRRTTSVPYRPDAGCTVELTALEARARSWATLGFEAYGPPADLRPALQQAVETFFASIDDLGADLSCGYPEWLATL